MNTELSFETPVFNSRFLRREETTFPIDVAAGDDCLFPVSSLESNQCFKNLVWPLTFNKCVYWNPEHDCSLTFTKCFCASTQAHLKKVIELTLYKTSLIINNDFSFTEMGSYVVSGGWNQHVIRLFWLAARLFSQIHFILCKILHTCLHRFITCERDRNSCQSNASRKLDLGHKLFKEWKKGQTKAPINCCLSGVSNSINVFQKDPRPPLAPMTT